MFLFTILILIHELGHYLTAYLFKWDVLDITIYPYGGCSHFNMDMNNSSLEEFLVLIMGPIFQIVFTYFMSFFLRGNDYSFLSSISFILLVFNLLPIYPLDGGKLLFLFCTLILSYYKSLKATFYISLGTYLIFLFTIILFSHSKLWILIFISLFIRVWKEQKNGVYMYQKFLLERYLMEYNFKKEKLVTKEIEMKKGYQHIFYKEGKLISEREYLRGYF